MSFALVLLSAPPAHGAQESRLHSIVSPPAPPVKPAETAVKIGGKSIQRSTFLIVLLSAPPASIPDIMAFSQNLPEGQNKVSLSPLQDITESPTPPVPNANADNNCAQNQSSRVSQGIEFNSSQLQTEIGVNQGGKSA